MFTLDVLSLVLLATVALGVAAAILAWHERPEPGATPLTAMLLGGVWWSAFLIFDLNSTSLGAKVFWANLRWVGIAVIPVAWLLFALEYTGRDRYVQLPYVAVLSIVPAITVALALTSSYHSLLYVDSALVEDGSRMVLSRSAGPWFWVIAGYTYLIGALGAFPLLKLVTTDARPFRGQSAAILVGILAPAGINVLFLVGVIPLSGLDPTPIGFAISGVAYLSAIKRFRLFGTSPAPNQSARRLVFERMHDGAVVVDTHGYLVDLNENAAEILGVERQEAIGTPAENLVPEFDNLPEDGTADDQMRIQGKDGTYFYDITVTEIGDYHGRTVGRLITFHDVGDLLRQQQRLEVLNRVLRHNIRTETNLITGYADLIGNDEVDDPEGLIKESANRIDEIGEKARDITELFDRDDDQRRMASLEALLHDVVSTVERTHPAVDIDCEPVPPDLFVAAELRPVLSNVVENAAEHNSAADASVRVCVDVTEDRDAVSVRVEDNGPGITEYERAVLQRGTETPLEHGSGLGLWLIQWGTNIVGGSVEFEENEPAGSIVTVEVPVLSTDDSTSSSPDPVVT